MNPRSGVTQSFSEPPRRTRRRSSMRGPAADVYHSKKGARGHPSTSHCWIDMDAALCCIGGFTWVKGGHAPELRPQQVPSGSSRMKQNLLAAAAPIQTTLGELTTLPQTP